MGTNIEILRKNDKSGSSTAQWDLQDAAQVFERIWLEVRSQSLMGGQPRSDSSERALELAQFALSAAESFGEIRWEAEAAWIMAYVLNANESFSESLSYYEQAVTKFEELGDHLRAARVRLGYTYPLLMTGRCQEAIRIGQEADARFVKSGDETRHARLQMNLGNVYHRQDDHATAYKYYSEAAALFRKLGDRRALAQVYLNLGNVLSSMGSLEESDLMHQRSADLCNQFGLTDLLVQANYNRAYLCFLRGRYSQALQMCGELRTLFSEHSSQRYLALCDLDEAEIYLQLNSPVNAASLSKRAADKFLTLGMQYEHAKALAFLGLALCKNHQFGEALDVFRSSRAIFQQEGNSYWEAILNLYIAEIMFSLRRISESRSLTQKAFKHFERLDTPSLKAMCLVLLGRLALEAGQLDRAQTFADEIVLLTKQRNIPLLLFPCYTLCAQIAERAGRLNEAREFYELAAKELETHRTQIHHDELRATFFHSKQQIYEALVQLYLYETGEAVISTAFNWIERSKSRSLIDLLGNELRSGGWQKDQGLLDRINRLREELNSYYLRTRPEASAAPAFTSGTFADEKEIELARGLKDLAQLDPEYASLQNVSIVSLENLQSTLDADTTVVEYFVARDEVIGLVITASKATFVRRICPLGRVKYLLERIQGQIEKFELTPENARAHEEELNRVLDIELNNAYSQLFAALRPFVTTDKLLIVPHGVLHLLPFHLLRDENGYLFEQFAISYASSASIAAYRLSRPDIKGYPVVIDGANGDKHPSALSKIGDRCDAFRVLEREDATRSNFAKEAVTASFLVIHSDFVFRQDNPMLSGFRLADGWVTASDLYSMTCRSNAVALCGYVTDARRNTSAEDLLAITRGFAYTGARSLLMSLWNAPDESTAELLAAFYESCETGKSRPKALIEAMNSIRVTHPHPYFWGSFLLFGH
jgi:CHAT domain-containing protein/tetratricopeptide (TPR) repeat protein